MDDENDVEKDDNFDDEKCGQRKDLKESWETNSEGPGKGEADVCRCSVRPSLIVIIVIISIVSITTIIITIIIIIIIIMMSLLCYHHLFFHKNSQKVKKIETWSQ